MERMNVFLLLLIFNNVLCQTLLSSKCHYADMSKKPDNSDRIAQYQNVPKQAACLIKCDKYAICESIVYDGTSGSCTLFRSKTSVLSLTSAEKTLMRTGQCVKTYGPTARINQPQQVSILEITCTQSTVYGAPYTCHRTLDGDNIYDSVWATAANSSPDWIMYTFDETKLITHIDIWRGMYYNNHCSDMEVTLGGITHVLHPPCDETLAPTLYTIFQKDSGLQTTQIRIECMNRCGKYFGFNEIIMLELPQY